MLAQATQAQNVSLWDGLVTAGGGYNLSINDDNEYVFVGIGLLEAVDQVKGVLPGLGIGGD